MATVAITLAFDDPEGVSIEAGTITFIAEETKLTVLKGSIATVTPGVSASINLEPNVYRVFYTDTASNKYQLGVIEVTGATSLSTLLDALTP